MAVLSVLGGGSMGSGGENGEGEEDDKECRGQRVGANDVVLHDQPRWTVRRCFICPRGLNFFKKMPTHFNFLIINTT